MKTGKIIASLSILLIFLISNTCFCQTPEAGEEVKLIRSAPEDCNQTYDPFKLVSRISYIHKRDSVTTISVNFTENCCVKFEPLIRFSKINCNYCLMKNTGATVAVVIVVFQ